MSHPPTKLPNLSDLHDQLTAMKLGIRGFVNNPGNESLRDCWSSWNERFDEMIQESLDDPSVAISLIGNTGAGKSTLINAVIGARLLPVSNNSACTAAITDVGFAEGIYSARIEFLSRDSWTNQLSKDFAAAKQELLDHSSQSLRIKDLPNVLRDRIKAVYEVNDDHVLTSNLFGSLRESPDIKLSFDTGHAEITDSDLDTFRKRINRYLESRYSFWPIVKSVRIRGPFEVLHDGVRLIDLPGLNDPNEARNEVTRNYIKRCRYVWLVFRITRNLTKDNVDLLQSDDFARQVIRDGRANSLTFIGTAADDITHEVGIEEFDLPDESTMADVVKINNSKVREKVKESLERVAETLMKNQSNEDWDAAQAIKQKLMNSQIFAVSGKDYLCQRGCLRGEPALDSVDQTEIPALTDYMRQICGRFGVEAHTSAILNKLSQLKGEIRREIETQRTSIIARRQTTELQRKEIQIAASSAKGFLENKLPECKATLEGGLGKDRVKLEERIKGGVRGALGELDSILDRWRKIHWKTLQAVCKRGGVYTGTTGRNDFPGDFEKPILDVITIRWAEFFGDRVTSQLESAVKDLNRTTEEFGRNLLLQVSKITDLSDAVQNDLQKQVDNNKRSLSARHDERRSKIEDQITMKQRDLSESVRRQTRENLRPAFEKASDESGSGMKDRIMDLLSREMKTTAGIVFRDVEKGMLGGVSSINDDLVRTFDTQMAEPVRKTAERISHNLLQLTLTSDGNGDGDLQVLSEFEKLLLAMTGPNQSATGAA